MTAFGFPTKNIDCNRSQKLEQTINNNLINNERKITEQTPESFNRKNIFYRLKIAVMIKSLQIMSVRQIEAQIKLTELCKTLKDSQYPLTLN